MTLKPTIPYLIMRHALLLMTEVTLNEKPDLLMIYFDSNTIVTQGYDFKHEQMYSLT
jgi:hypothetical protein